MKHFIDIRDSHPCIETTLEGTTLEGTMLEGDNIGRDNVGRKQRWGLK
jgi:hypothetical protein